MRLLDSDEPANHRSSFEVVLKHSVLNTYPLAPVVKDVDDKFVRLLERMATLDLDKKRAG